MQFSIFSENFLYLYKKFTHPIIQPLSQIKIFWPNMTDFLLTFFSPILKDAGIPMTLPNQLTPKQINIFQMTAWLQKYAEWKQRQTQNLRKQ